MADYLEIVRMMPKDWDDGAGWNKYYRAYHAEGLHLDETIVHWDLQFMVLSQMERIQAFGPDTIWLPDAAFQPH